LNTTAEKTSVCLLRSPDLDVENDDENDEGDEEDNKNDEDGQETAKKEKERNLVPGKGISDTRWISRASTLHRFNKPQVLRAALDTINKVFDETTDPKARAAATGYKATIRSVNFIVLLVAFKPLLGAVNTVSEYPQSPTIDINTAMNEIAAINLEIENLRTEAHRKKVDKDAADLAVALGGQIGGRQMGPMGGTNVS